MIATSLLDRQTDATEDVAVGDLVLRVCTPPRNGQIVRLNSVKCTVGSGSKCTLRLQASGVAPLHCLILRGPGRAVVRSWNSDTRLNHRAFTDEELASGDLLGIGPIELEVVSIGEAVAGFDPIVEEREILAEQHRTLTQDRQSLADEHRRLADQARTVEQERQRLEQERQTQDQERQKLVEERCTLADECLRWEAERNELEHRQNKQREAEAARLAEMESRHQAVSEARQALEQDQKRLDEAHLALADERRRWEAEQVELTEERRRWEAEAAESDRRLVEQREAEAMRPAETDSADKTDSAEEAEEPPRTVEFQEPSAKAPVDLNEVFRRVGAKVEPADSEPTPELPSKTAAVEHNVEIERASAPPAPKISEKDDEKEEESIDQYMVRLMDRIRATDASSTKGPPNPRSVVHAVASEGETSADSAESPSGSGMAQSNQPTETLERKKRTTAPETYINLTALRELANLSAHSAIDRHARRSLIRLMRSKLTVAVVALFSGAVLLWMWKTFNTRELTLGAALVAILAALYWGVQYALLTGRLIVSKSGNIDLNRGDSAANANPPSDGAVESASEARANDLADADANR